MGIVTGHAADVSYSLLAEMDRLCESLTLKIMIKYVEDLDDHVQAKLPCQPACVCKKMALLGPAVCS